MAGMGSIVLFGIGSPIVAEYEETCKRLGYVVGAAVMNRPRPAYFSDESKIVDVRNLGEPFRGMPCLCPMFTPRNRSIAVAEATGLGFAFAAALIDPTAIVASSVAIAYGSFVNAGCIIGAGAALAEHVLLNRGSSVGHHVRIGAFASLGPGVVVGGQARIGSGAMIGAGAVVLPQVVVGPYAIVGAGSVVVADVPARTKVVGNPARVRETALAEF
jgi:sugar O-acyltransferase (sialic acid O-acetyltransferase NeuD family)